MRTNLMIDPQSHKAMKQVPKPFNASMLVRWLLKCISSDEKQWSHLIRTDPEIKAVQDWLRPKLKKALMIDDHK